VKEGEGGRERGRGGEGERGREREREIGKLNIKNFGFVESRGTWAIGILNYSN